MVFPRRLRAKYGSTVEYSQRALVKTEIKLAKLLNTKVFLLNCRRLKLIPSFLNFAIHICVENDKSAVRINKLTTRFKQQILSVLISDSIISINKTEEAAKVNRERLERSTESADYEQSVRYASNKRKHTFERYRSRQRRKLEKLKTNLRTQTGSCDNWVLNCTDEPLPAFVIRSLQLGSGYNTPDPHVAPYVRLLSEIETAVHRNPSADIIRQDVSNAIINHINYTKQSFHDKHEDMRKEIQKSRKYLREKDDLVVTKADKGKTIVVMKRDEYNEKMNSLVNDEATYEPIGNDPTKRTLKKINTIIDNWHERGFIQYSERTKLKIFNCNPPRVYGLPKTHKEGRPLRIINSTIGTATYRMAKYLAEILNHVTGRTEHHIVNSFQFAEEMRTQQFEENSVLFSLDVVSLFTNVPVDFALESIRLRWDEIKEHTTIDDESFFEMLQIVLESTFFQHNGKFYKQNFGIPMGSPLSPVVANLVLERIEKATLVRLRERGVIPVFFKRYVDDCLLCAREEEVETVLNEFNGFHERLQFTLEMEVEGKIKFLDVVLRREDNTITTEWFPKDIDGRYLDYTSVSPFIHKKNTIIALVDRALKLTHAKYRKNTLNIVKQILANNNYPCFLVEKVIRERLHLMYNSLQHNTHRINNFVTIPYIHGLGEKLSKYLRNHEFKVAYKPVNKIKDILFTKTKDPIPKNKNTNVVYEVPCGACNKSYIGETSQFLTKRLEQHKYNVKTKNISGTGLSQHTVEEGHIFDFDKTKILDQISNSYKRLTAETFYIKIRGDDKVVNKQKDAMNFKTAYNSIITKLKTPNSST